MANDPQLDDIADIMSEIESLQKELDPVAGGPAHVATASAAPMAEKPALRAVPNPAPSEPQVDMADFRGGSSGGDDVSLEETLGSMKEEPSQGKSLLDVSSADEQVQAALDAEEDVPETKFDEVEPMSSVSEPKTLMERRMSSEKKDGELTLRLRGSMTLKLEYEMDGKEVAVGFEDDFLFVRLADGTEFKIPVRSQARAA